MPLPSSAVCPFPAHCKGATVDAVLLPRLVLGEPVSMPAANMRRREVPHGKRGRFPALSSSVPYLMFLRSAVRAFTTALKASSLPGATHLSGWSSTASFR